MTCCKVHTDMLSCDMARPHDADSTTACAQACKAVPEMNSSWQGDFIRQYSEVDVNVAVMTPNGLMVPFVRSAHAKGLLAISQEIKGLAEKVRGGESGDDWDVCYVRAADISIGLHVDV